ncbi:deoxyribonuclease-1-like [Stylophora pistillata]|uniref:deoxyribonuclease-1-like n=1 Tax=Stylophora pistillata TaxID=50429 RepID=UPI000C04E89A|nr:deoxyribonuclease-1-like [Stylophora pistillata]
MHPCTDASDFAMAAIRTFTNDAKSEIDHLVDVYNDIVQRWTLEDVMILGDLNAGCNYVTKSDWGKIRLATDKRFYWLISDLMDITKGKSDCPYDKYNMIRGIFPDSAHVFNYKKAYGLTQDENNLPNQLREVCIRFSSDEGF